MLRARALILHIILIAIHLSLNDGDIIIHTAVSIMSLGWQTNSLAIPEDGNISSSFDNNFLVLKTNSLIKHFMYHWLKYAIL